MTSSSVFASVRGQSYSNDFRRILSTADDGSQLVSMRVGAGLYNDRLVGWERHTMLRQTIVLVEGTAATLLTNDTPDRSSATHTALKEGVEYTIAAGIWHDIVAADATTPIVLLVHYAPATTTTTTTTISPPHKHASTKRRFEFIDDDTTLPPISAAMRLVQALAMRTRRLDWTELGRTLDRALAAAHSAAAAGDTELWYATGDAAALLDAAALIGRDDLVAFLLDRGARSHSGQALVSLAQRADVSLLQRALEPGPFGTSDRRAAGTWPLEASFLRHSNERATALLLERYVFGKRESYRATTTSESQTIARQIDSGQPLTAASAEALLRHNALNFTPLQWACYHGRLEHVRQLLALSTELDFAERAPNGETSADALLRWSPTTLIKPLLDYGGRAGVDVWPLLGACLRRSNELVSQYASVLPMHTGGDVRYVERGALLLLDATIGDAPLRSSDCSLYDEETLERIDALAPGRRAYTLCTRLPLHFSNGIVVRASLVPDDDDDDDDA